MKYLSLLTFIILVSCHSADRPKTAGSHDPDTLMIAHPTIYVRIVPNSALKDSMTQVRGIGMVHHQKGHNGYYNSSSSGWTQIQGKPNESPLATKKDIQRIEKEINDLKRIITRNNRKADDIDFEDSGLTPHYFRFSKNGRSKSFVVEPFTSSPYMSDARRCKDTSDIPSLDSTGKLFGKYPWYDSALESDTLFSNSNMYKPVIIGGCDVLYVKKPLTKEDSAAILKICKHGI